MNWLNKTIILAVVLVLGGLFYSKIEPKPANNMPDVIEKKFDIEGGGTIYRFTDVVNGFRQMGYFAIDKDGKLVPLFHHP